MSTEGQVETLVRRSWDQRVARMRKDAKRLQKSADHILQVLDAGEIPHEGVSEVANKLETLMGELVAIRELREIYNTAGDD